MPGADPGADAAWAVRILVPVFGTLLCLIAVALATELHLKLGYEIFTEQGLAAIFGLFMAWGIGANDVANAMATSVGSRAITVKQALIIAAIFEFSGGPQRHPSQHPVV